MGAAGIIFPITSIALAETEQLIITSGSGTTPGTIGPIRPWTPPQYSKTPLTIITVPATVSSSSGQTTTSQTSYVFDAVLKLSHRRTIRKTQHPVLTGANISDHAYAEPAKLVLDIGMSDAMASFTSGVWVGASTKSVSAWQILKNLEINKTLLTVTTRLDTYFNMLIQSISTDDDNKTKHGLRAVIVLEELIAASVSSQPASSSRPQTTGSSASGTVQSVAPSPQQLDQNALPSAQYPNTPTFPTVPGAGNVSSNSLGQVPTE